MNIPDISIIITFYNNEGSIGNLFYRVSFLQKEAILENKVIELILVEDGSKDNTLNVLKSKLNSYPNFKIKLVKLTRNFGSYNSFMAGVDQATGRCCVYLHSDLQDPPELIPQMYKFYLDGFKLVIANRSEREDENIFSSFYHWFVQKFILKNIPSGGFDLVLFDNQIKKQLSAIAEKHTNNIYLISWLGFPFVSIPYKRLKREHGVSQWSLNGKIKLVIDTIFSFTRIPVKVIYLTTLLFFLMSASIFVIYLIFKLHYLLLCLFLSGSFFILSINLLVVVEYLDRINENGKNRPSYIIDETWEN